MSTTSPTVSLHSLKFIIEPEVCEYPDSGKVGVFCGNDEQGLMHLSRQSDAADYWDGE